MGTLREANSLKIDIVTNSSWGSNTYILVDEGSKRAIVVDPGEIDGFRTLQCLQNRGASVDYILLTHEHWDHCAGTEALRDVFGCPVICSMACSDAIQSPVKNLSRYLVGIDLTCHPADRHCEDLENRLEWQNRMLKFHPTPGHSAGGVCIELEGTLFTGDTLLSGGKLGPHKLPGGNRLQIARSLIYLVRCISNNVTVYPGHGERFTLGALPSLQRAYQFRGSPEIA